MGSLLLPAWVAVSIFLMLPGLDGASETQGSQTQPALSHQGQLGKGQSYPEMANSHVIYPQTSLLSPHKGHGVRVDTPRPNSAPLGD